MAERKRKLPPKADPGRHGQTATLPRQTKTVAGHLAAQRLFEGLPPAAIHELAQQTIARSYRRGHYLYQRGDPPTFVFIITSGLVALTDLDEQGHVIPVQTHGAGSVFGLSTVLLAMPRRFTASSVTDVETLLIRKDSFERVYRAFPELAYRVAEALAGMLCRSEQTTSEFSSAPVAARIARFLLQSAGEVAGPPSTAELELSRQDLALVVGTSRETVTRVLTRISRSGLIALRGHRVVILDRDALQRLAG